MSALAACCVRHRTSSGFHPKGELHPPTSTAIVPPFCPAAVIIHPLSLQVQDAPPQPPQGPTSKPPPLSAVELAGLREDIRTCADPVPEKKAKHVREHRPLVPPRPGAQTRFLHVVGVHDDYGRIDLVKKDMDRALYPVLGYVRPPRYGVFMQLKAEPVGRGAAVD